MKKMEINLVKIKFNDWESYKYKPFTYCCEKIKNNKNFLFADNDFENDEDYEKNGFSYIPKFCISLPSDEIFEEDYNRNSVINYCPYCGEKIEIKLTDEIDISKKYNELSRQRDILNRKYNKSTKNREEIRKEYELVINKIDELYEITELNMENN